MTDWTRTFLKLNIVEIQRQNLRRLDRHEERIERNAENINRLEDQ